MDIEDLFGGFDEISQHREEEMIQDDIASIIASVFDPFPDFVLPSEPSEQGGSAPNGLFQTQSFVH